MNLKVIEKKIICWRERIGDPSYQRTQMSTAEGIKKVQAQMEAFIEQINACAPSSDDEALGRIRRNFECVGRAITACRSKYNITTLSE